MLPNFRTLTIAPWALNPKSQHQTAPNPNYSYKFSYKTIKIRYYLGDSNILL